MYWVCLITEWRSRYITLSIIIIIIINIIIIRRYERISIITFCTCLYKLSISRILKTESKADRTAKGYIFIYSIFRLDKTSLHQWLEKLGENRITAVTVFKIIQV